MVATNRFVGEGVEVVQVDTWTPANIEATDIFTLTSVGPDGVTEVLT